MKKYTYKKKINIPIYTGRFQIIFTNDIEVLQEGNTGLENFSTDDDGLILLTVIYNPDAYLFSNGIISHECLHATIYLFNWIHLKLSTEEDNFNEAYTYMLSWFVNEVYNFMKEKNIKIK